jgi:hypothetical protein
MADLVAILALMAANLTAPSHTLKSLPHTVWFARVISITASIGCA